MWFWGTQAEIKDLNVCIIYAFFFLNSYAWCPVTFTTSRVARTVLIAQKRNRLLALFPRCVLHIFSPKATHSLLQLILIPSQVTPTSSIHFHFIHLLASIGWSMFFVNKHPRSSSAFHVSTSPPHRLFHCLISNTQISQLNLYHMYVTYGYDFESIIYL